eukprot:COSAG02_NODE_33956_length_491_cov_1.561224_1_plen_28_part_01
MGLHSQVTAPAPSWAKATFISEVVSGPT